MRKIFFCLLVLQALATSPVQARESVLEVIVADPYLEMHTGPASGYPVFYVVERGEKIQVLYSKTDWYKIRTDRNKEGWVHRDELRQTLTLDGQPTVFPLYGMEGFSQRSWEVGIMGGDFEGAASMTLYGTYFLTPTLSVELSGTQAIGNFSSSDMANFRIAAHPFPDWRISPFFALGAGYITTRPDATLVSEVDRDDPIANVSIGTHVYLTKRFIFRLEYNNYRTFTSRNDNEEVEEWKAGFAVFF